MFRFRAQRVWSVSQIRVQMWKGTLARPLLVGKERIGTGYFFFAGCVAMIRLEILL
jgi:hypothetical protein